MTNLRNRIIRLEAAIKKENWKFILAPYAYQHGLNGEIIRESNEEQVVESHLAEHPEDRGKRFNIVERIFVTPEHRRV